MSKYINIEQAIEAYRKSLEQNKSFISMLQKLPSVEVVHCGECKWENDCSQLVDNFEGTASTLLYWCSDGVKEEE